MAVDEDKLNAFLGKMVGDMGAVHVGGPGDRSATGSGSIRRWRRRDRGDERASWPNRRARPSAMRREWLAAQAAAGYVDYDRTAKEWFSLNPEQAMVFFATEILIVWARLFFAGGFEPLLQSVFRERAEDHRGLPHRERRWLARARPVPVPRHRAVLPAWLQREPGQRLDPGARRRRGEAERPGR